MMASRCCWSSRTSNSPKRLPTMSACWSRAEPSIRRRWRRSRPSETRSRRATSRCETSKYVVVVGWVERSSRDPTRSRQSVGSRCARPNLHLVDRPVARFDLLLQQKALDLPGRGKRQLAENFHPLRQLVGRDLAAQEVVELLQGHLRAALGHDAQAVALPEPGICHADHGDMQHLRMRGQDLLDLAPEELLPAAIDD